MAQDLGLDSLFNQEAQVPARRQRTEAPGSIEDFVRQVAPAAQRVAQRIGAPVDAIIGQWGLETGWGKSVIPGTNNLGNIKDPSGRGVAATDNMTGSRDRYRVYGSTDEFADDFAGLLERNGRYKGARGAQDPQAYFSALKAGGYAEDPAYVDSGVKATQMVARARGAAPAPGPALPDLDKAPKWADVAAKPEFLALSAEDKAAAKSQFFDYWVAPHAGESGSSLREQFLSKTDADGLSADLAPEQFKAGVAGMQSGYFANAARNNASIINAMDRMDRGERVPMEQDPTGYGQMTPEQRAEVRKQVGGSFAGSAARAIKYNAEQQQYKRNPAAAAAVDLANKGDFKGAWNAFASDPAGVIQQLTVESTPNMIPSLAVGAASGGVGIAVAGNKLLRDGLPGFITGFAGGSFPVEFVSSVAESLRESGVNMADYAAVEAKLRDPDFIRAAGERANVRGTAIATADAAGAGLAMPLKAGVGQIVKNVGRAGANVATEVGTEMAGEFGAQVASGQDIKLGDVLAEGVGALPQAAATTAGRTVIESVKQAPPATKHATDAAAESIVRELAQAAGIDESVVLPKAPPAPVVAPAPAASTQGDQDVLDFAESRADALRAKQAGVATDGTDSPDAAGLAPDEQAELDALEAAGTNPAALRQAIGYADEAPAALEPQGPFATRDEAAAFIGEQRRRTPNAPVAAPVQHADGSFGIEIGAIEQPQETHAPEPEQMAGEAPQASGPEEVEPIGEPEAPGAQDAQQPAVAPESVAELDTSTKPVDSAPEIEQVPAAPATTPKTEKEARALKDYSAKWFGAADKAQAFIDKQGIGETHQAAQDGLRFVIQKKADPITAAAHEAATSPLNDIPQPTDAQKAAGNYKKGHVTFAGLDLAIENPIGSERSGKDPDGKPWSVAMTAHYGYVKRTEGADGDQVDVYLADNPAEDAPVFVFDQYNPDGSFDEHKAVLGARTLDAAKEIYDAHFSDGTGPQRRKAMQAMPASDFKKWAMEGDTSKPVRPRSENEARERAAEPTWWTSKTPAERVWLMNASGIHGVTATTRWQRLTPAQRDALNQQWGDKHQAADEAGAAPSKNARPERKTRSPSKQQAEAEAQRSSYFAPGNIVPGYGGSHDQVLSYTPASEDRSWSVKVKAVVKSGGQWTNDPNDNRERSHSTEPSERDYARGPVERAKGAPVDDLAAINAQMPAGFEVRDEGADKGLALFKDGVRTYMSGLGRDGGGELLRHAQRLAEQQKPDVNLDSMFDEVLAEEVAKDDAKKTTPKTERRASVVDAIGKPGSYIVRAADGTNLATFDAGKNGAPARIRHFFEAGETRSMVDSAIAEHSASTAQEKPKTEREAKERRTAAEAATSAAKNTAAGLGAAIDGLGELFGGHGRLGSGPTFDEQTYAKAKPLFQQAVAHLKDAGTDMREAMRAIVRMVLDKFGPQAAGNMKPYVTRFLEEASRPEQNDNIQPESADASPLQSEGVPARDQEQAGSDAVAGDRDRESVAPGVAESDQGADRGRDVSGPADGAGSDGTGRAAERYRDDAPGAARDRGNARPEPETAERVADHVIDANEIGKGGLTKKYRDNVAAIRLLKTIETEGRVATAAERKTLARFVGWGAMKGPFDPANKAWAKQHAEIKELLTPAEFAAARKSTRDAHYTSPTVVGAMYDAMRRLGFTGGRLLESSVGIGNFFGMMPKDMRAATQLHGVELDSLTSRMVAALYPNAKIAKATGFEDYQIPAEFFDASIGNPPFGEQPLVDSDRSAYSGTSIHNYFLSKIVDKLRPGGIAQVVVSHSFLDAQDTRTRKWIDERAALVGAVRLPNTAFKENAGTEVVTDILIFQKRGTNGLPNDVAPWVDVVDQSNLDPKTGEHVTHKVSQFFAAHPEFVLGTPTAAGTMYRTGEYTVAPTGDLKDQLAGWVGSLPEKIFTPIERAPEMFTDMAVPDGVKVDSFYVDATGKIMQRGEDALGEKTAHPWIAKNEKAIQRMRGMIGLRDSLRAQMRLERSLDATTDEIEANRAELNRRYDAFLKDFGHLNSIVNRGIFMDDAEAHLAQALEFDYDRGISKTTAEKEGIEPKAASAKKADIFERRVAFPPADHMHVASAKDALLASLNYRGRADTAYMAEVYGKDVAAIIDELGDLVFEDPAGALVTADDYLSGDVKTKLDEAKAAAQEDSKFKRNVAALEKVIPADKRPSEISVSLGAAFVPGEIYAEFIKHITGGAATPAYIKATAQWVIAFTSEGDAALNRGKFGTSRMSAQDIIQLTMLGRGAVVKNVTRNPDGSTTTTVDDQATQAAREKQNSIVAEWQSWVWADPERADRVAAIFNDRMNRIVDRVFDGSHMTMPGMNPTISLLAHQKNGVWRGLQSLRVLYDHVVGAGKTYQMAALAMEMRRLGIARKPLFVVPNHLTLQWRSEFTRLYPGSNILAATPEDFSKDKRQRMFSKIVTGDWDAIVVGHSSLKKIGLPPATERAILEEQITELSTAIEETKRGRGDRNIVRDMEGIKARLEAKMKDRLAAIGKRDKAVTFDDLGVDALFVDEMHEFKNLAYNSTMDRNPGMGNPAGSSKAFDMFVKVRWLFDTFGQRAPFVTATGTPVSNSLVEMFNMQRYMQYPTLKAEGLHLFDAWAKQFGSIENVYEVAPSGSGYRQSTRFAKFRNLPALMGLYNSFADTVTLDDLKAQEQSKGKSFPVPKMVGGRPALVVAQRSPEVANLMGVPSVETGDSGEALFGADLGAEIKIEKNATGEKYTLSIGDRTAGTFDTEQEARLKVVELAVTPRMALDPESILGRFERLRDLVKLTKGKVNALSLTGEANKAGLDYRLIDPAAKDFPGSKINLAVANMLKVYRQWTADKGAQLVFCDLSVPLSARSNYGAKDRRLYVREDGVLAMKRGTLHAIEGHEDIPFFLVARGEKDAKRFDAYDAATGAVLMRDFRTRADARDAIAEALSSPENRQKLIDERERAGEIGQDEIDDYNNEHEVETEGVDAFGREDIAGMSGSAKFSVYDDIKAKLIAKGVPEREIAFVHDYSTPVAKDKLFKAVNAGDIRFLLGSTPKMGAGTNVQERLVGLHHIDAPWRPSDLEQREGRIIRRGNTLYERDPEGFEVFVARYATEQTYDTRRWQILEHKARGIEQLRNYDGTANEIEDIDGEAASAADMKAAASGDPLILEETKLRNDVRRLEQLRAAHADEVLAMTRRARSLQEDAEKYGPRRVAEIEDMIATVAKHPADAPVLVDGKATVDKSAAGAEIGRAFVKASVQHAETTITYRGVEFTMGNPWADVVAADAPTDRIATWTDSKQFSPSGFIQRMANYVDRLPAMLDAARAAVKKAGADAKSVREQAGHPFAQAADLDRMRAEHARVQRALMAKGPAVREDQKQLVADGIASQKARLEELGYGAALREMFSEDGPGVMSAAAGARLPESAWLSVGALSQVVDDRLAQFAHQPPVLIRDRDTDVLGGAAGDRDGFATGMVRGGKIYLFRDGLSSAPEAVRALWHEMLHYGLRRFLTEEQYIDQMQRLYDRDPWIKSKADAWIAGAGADVKQAQKRSDAYARARGVDEALAELAEINEGGYRNTEILAKTIRTVTRWLAALADRFGFSEAAARYRAVTNDEARALVREIFRKLRDDAPATSGDWGFTADLAFAMRGIQDGLAKFFGGEKKHKARTFGAYHKTLSTQFNKALHDPEHFGKVFGLANAMQNEVSLASIRPAELAPGILHKIDDFRSAARTLVQGRKGQESIKRVANAVFAGTLAGSNVAQGKVWTEAELRGQFKLSDAEVGLYRQARAAIDASLDELAAAEAYAMAQGFVPKRLRADVIKDPGNARSILTGAIERQVGVLRASLKAAEKDGNEKRALDLEDTIARYTDTKSQVAAVFNKADTLKLAGYAPLMRFGKFTVLAQRVDPTTGELIRDDEGNTITEFYAQFETEGEADAQHQRLAAEYAGDRGVSVRTVGVKSEKAHELYAGMSPETLAMFAEEVGADKVTKSFYQLALSERSSLKRRLERKGTAGYSEDLARVLSSFITSNGRFAAQRYYLRDLTSTIKHIPQSKGDVLDEAIALKAFVLNPGDPAAPVSALMFAWYIGGSAMSAMVNLTQTPMMTLPYLTQYGAANATKAVAKAVAIAVGRRQITDPALRAGLKRASQEGIVEAQEIFHLYSQGAQGIASGLVKQLERLPKVGGAIKAGSESARARVNAFLTLWGMMFSAAESVNRKIAFIGAWEAAKGAGVADPYAAAVRAVNETQGIYNKVNRPNWARGSVGRVVMTFKQFSIMYVELLHRMATKGGPEGKRAATIMLAMMILGAGVSGLPGADDLDDLIDTVGQWLGYDTNMKRSKREWAHATLGKEFGDLALYGVSAHLPLDFSGRLGLGNLIPGTGALKPSNEGNRTRDTTDLLGPAAGLVTQIVDAYDAASSGNPGQAARNLAPKAIKDLATGIDIAATGEAKNTRGFKNMDAGLGDAAMKSVGANPTKFAQASRARGPMMQDTALQKKTETDIVERWARGILENKPDMVNEAQEDLRKWNLRNPRTPIAILPAQIKGAVRNRVTDQNTRMLRSTPKELRGNAAIGLDSALQ